MGEGLASASSAHPLRGVILRYSLAWAVGAGLVVAFFCLGERTFLWNQDGLYQHFFAYSYLCGYVEGLLSGQPIGMFSFTMGQGADMLSTLSTYDFADPISWLTAILLPLPRLARYSLMCLVKLYLVGLSFIALCWSAGVRRWMPVVGGAVAYVFSAAILIVFNRHPNFINWAYFLPFIVAGVEFYLRCGKPAPLIVAVALNAFTSLYTLYMDIVLVAVYVVVRCLCAFLRERTAARFTSELASGLKVAGFCLVGMLLAAPVLAPTVYAYLVNARIMDAAITPSLVYGEKFIRGFAASVFLANSNPGYSTNLGLNPFMLVPLILLFTVRRKNTELKVLLVLAFLLALSPGWGQLMNGFGYASNRWTFVIPLLASMSFVRVFDELLAPSKAQVACVVVLSAAYLGGLLALGWNSLQGYKAVTLLVAGAMVAAYAVLALSRFSKMGGAVFAVVVFGSLFQVCCTYSYEAGAYLKEFYQPEQVAGECSDESSAAAYGLEDGFYRVESKEWPANKEVYTGVHGTDIWWSMLPSDVASYYASMELGDVKQNCHIGGLDARVGLLALADVRYYTAASDAPEPVPWGYDEVEGNGTTGEYRVFRNGEDVSLGIAYAACLAPDWYDELNGVEKELALLRGASVDVPVEGIDTIEPDSTVESLPYRVTLQEDVEFSDGQLSASAGGVLEIEVDVPDSHMVFLRFGDHTLISPSNVNIIAQRTCQGAVQAEREARFSSPSYRWHDGRTGVTFNLGSGGAGVNTVRLTFERNAYLDFDELEVLAVPLGEYEAGLRNLSSCLLEDVTVGNDYVSGNIAVPERRLLQMSIPYSIGWSATVDGNPVDIVRSDGMYLAFPVDGGTHSVELRYHTPFLLEGTCLAVAVLAVLLLLRFRSRKTHDVSVSSY